MTQQEPAIRRPYHHGGLYEALIAAGEAALEELPIAAVTLREIARRAGVSHAAPKHHFATLGDLLGEIAARGFERFVETLGAAAEQAPDATPEGRLLAMGRAYLRFADAHPAVYGLMFGKQDHCTVTPHLASSALAAWEQLETATARVVGQGKAPAAAMLVWSCVHGLAMLRLEHRIPPHLAPASALEGTLRMMLAGLVTEAGA